MKKLDIERAGLPTLLNTESGLRGIELGVASGDFSAKLWKSGAFAELWGVDAYGDHHDTQEYLNALRLVGLDANYRLLRMFFDDAVELFPDNYFDFIYIDGYAHTGENAGKTLYDWYPKLKQGGLIGGHDYHEDWPLVMASVDRFAEDSGMAPMLTQLTTDPGPQDLFPSWVCIKDTTVDLMYPDDLKKLQPPSKVKKAAKPLEQMSPKAGIKADRPLKKFRRMRKAKIKKELPKAVSQRISQLQGTKAGQRCLIVGSAPSIKQLDLGTVSNCDIFALNSAQELCKDLTCGEKILVVSDPLALGGDISSAALGSFDRVLVSADLEDAKAENLFHFEYYSKPQIYQGFAQAKLGKPLFHCHTVAGYAIQIAVAMGYSQIYLSGIDLNFSGPEIHFYKSSARERDWARRISSPKESRMRAGIAYLAHWAKKKKVDVVNVSPVDGLPLVQHANFDAVFGPNGMGV